MELQELTPRTFQNTTSKEAVAFSKFELLLNELRMRNLPSEIVSKINLEIELINNTSTSELKKQLRKSNTKTLRILEKELKLVPKNYYRNLWMVIGMSAFGIPMGVAFGTAIGNMAFLGIGLPIGMAIGIAVGSSMDKKAHDENRQLKI
jgi:hypothetical protein